MNPSVHRFQTPFPFLLLPLPVLPCSHHGGPQRKLCLPQGHRGQVQLLRVGGTSVRQYRRGTLPLGEGHRTCLAHCLACIANNRSGICAEVRTKGIDGCRSPSDPSLGVSNRRGIKRRVYLIPCFVSIWRSVYI